MTTVVRSIDGSVDPSVDPTISRDLAALAADNRRAWRTADEVLAGLDVPRARPAAARPEILSLAALAQVFARRVAWIAGGGVGLLVLSVVMVTAFMPVGEEEYDVALVIDRGLIPALGWAVVPALAAYALAGRLAGRWFVASLQHSAAPDALGRRLIRRADGWSVGLAIGFVAGTALLFGVLFFALDQFWPKPWYDSFPDGTTRRIRLYPLAVAFGAVLVLAGGLGRASARELPRLRALAARRWLVVGVLGIVLTVAAGLRFAIWPMAPYAPSRVGAQIALTVSGTLGVLLVVVVLVLRVRARDERTLAACSPATSADAVRMLPLHHAAVHHAAWLAAGAAAVGTLGLLLLALQYPFSYMIHGHLVLQYPFRYVADGVWHRPNPIEWLVFERSTTWASVLALVLAAHQLGIRAGHRVVARLIGEADRASALDRTQRLVARLSRWSIASVIIGATVVVTTYAVSARVFQHNLFAALSPRLTEPQVLSATAIRQTLLAALLVVILGGALARACAGPSRWVTWLRHPLVLALGIALWTWAGAAASRVQLFLWDYGWAPGRGSFYHAQALPLLRPALILALTLGTFLIAAWIALRLRARAARGSSSPR